jgi:hypothetical protein
MERETEKRKNGKRLGGNHGVIGSVESGEFSPVSERFPEFRPQAGDTLAMICLLSERRQNFIYRFRKLPSVAEQENFMVKKRLRGLALFTVLGIVPVVGSQVVLHAQQVNEDQRAYQAGYQNGVNAARANRPMNLSTGDWHGDRLNDYQRGYHEGYESVAGHGHDNDRYGNDPERQRAYQTGYQNGVNAAEHNRPMNANTGDWHGDRLQAYQEGYEQGYHSVRR